MPELGGETPLETCLAEAREAGFTGIEKGNKFPNEPAASRRCWASSGSSSSPAGTAASCATARSRQEVAAMRPHLDLLKAVGAKVMVLAETSGTVQGDRTCRCRTGR